MSQQQQQQYPQYMTMQMADGTLQAYEPLYLRGVRHTKYVTPQSIEEHQPYYPQIENIVSVANGTPVNLARACGMIPASEYKPNHFAAATLRIGDSTVLFYSTGKLLVAGAKCLEQSLYTSHLYMIILGLLEQREIKYDPITRQIKEVKWRRLCRDLRVLSIDIANIVGKTKYDKRAIDLDEIYELYRLWVRYSPSTFPASRVTMRKFSSLVFDSGFWLFLGLKKIDQLIVTFRKLKSIVLKAHHSARRSDAVRYHMWQLQRLSKKDRTQLQEKSMKMLRLRLQKKDSKPIPRANFKRVKMLKPLPPSTAASAPQETKTDRFERRIQSYYNKKRFLFEQSPFEELEKQQSCKRSAAASLVDSHKPILKNIRRIAPQSFDMIGLNVNKT